MDSLDEAIEILVVVPQIRGSTDHFVERLRNRDPLFGGKLVDRALPPELPGRHGGFIGLEAGAVDTAETEGVRLATMHRVKGLEFDRVVMASINADLVPLPIAIDARGDAVERESAETEERALVYVAATRAKKELLVLSFGTPSRLL